MTYDHEDNGLELLATITKDTCLAAGAKYNTINDKYMLFGFNIYAIDEDNVDLLETFETLEQAEYIRETIFNKMMAGQELIII